MNSVYEMLNGADVDLSEYKVYEFNDIEKQKLKKEIRKKLKNKPFVKKRKAAIAMVAVMSTVLISAFMGNGVLAKINLIRTGIEEFFHYNHNSLEDYKTVINKEVTRNEVTVKLNEVILDDDQILISSTFNTDKIKWNEADFVMPEVYINGRNVMDNGGGAASRAKIINDSTCSFLTSIKPNNNKLMNLTGDLNIEVVYDKIQNRDGELKGKWVFKFTSNKDRLSADIKKIQINTAFTVENGPKLTIESLRISPVATKLNYTQTDELKYHISFIVNDQNGKEIKWVSGHNFSGFGTEMYDALDENTTKIMITPVIKAVSQPKEGNGEEIVDYNKVLKDQTFEINIK